MGSLLEERISLRMVKSRTFARVTSPAEYVCLCACSGTDLYLFTLSHAAHGQHSAKACTAGKQQNGKYLSPRNQTRSDRRRSQGKLEPGYKMLSCAGQTLTLTGGAGNFRPVQGSVTSVSGFDSPPPTALATCQHSDFLFPGVFSVGETPYVDYTTQHAPRETDFRVKRAEQGASPWKRSVWSRGGPGYAGWRLWGPGLGRGPFWRRLAPGNRRPERPGS